VPCDAYSQGICCSELLEKLWWTGERLSIVLPFSDHQISDGAAEFGQKRVIHGWPPYNRVKPRGDGHHTTVICMASLAIPCSSAIMP
jgi:hypothetical protein